MNAERKFSYAVLRGERDYWRYLAGTVVCRFGDSLDALAFSWVMYQVTGSASLMAFVMAMNFVPTIILQPLTGVFADRWNKKRVIALCNLGRALAVLATAAGFWAGALSPAWLVVVTLVNSTLEAAETPCALAAAPQLLPPDAYDAGLSLKSTASRFAELGGTALAGVLLAAFGPLVSFLLDAASFLFMSLMAAGLHLGHVPPQAALDLSGYFSQLKEGARLVTGRRVVLTLAALGALINLVLAPVSSFTVPYLSQLGMNAVWLGGCDLAQSLAMGAAALIYPAVHARLGARSLTTLSFAGTSVVFALMGGLYFAPAGLARALVVLGCFAVVGVMVGFIQMIFSTSLVRVVPQEMLGRVGGLFNAVITALLPASGFICSGAALFAPLWSIFIGFGLLGLLVALFAARAETLKEL